MSDTGVVLHELVSRTNGFVQQARILAANHGAATDALAMLDDMPAPQAVVVAGETKKGKSSLVNALLERPSASPVSVSVATATYMMFQWGPKPAAWLRGAATTSIPFDDLARWVTVDGLAGNDELAALSDPTGRVAAAGGTPKPLPVDVRLPVEMLKGLSLIDTPGVGGLVGAHALATMEALKIAGSMVFVTDIGVPLTTVEADFLNEAVVRAGLSQLIIVANMADKLNGDDLTRAMAALEARIAKHLPTLSNVPVIAVSAADALAAMDPSTPAAQRDAMLEWSGIAELHKQLQRIAVQSPVLTQLQRLRVVHEAARAIEATQAAVEAVAPHGLATKADLEKARIATLNFADDSKMHFQVALNKLRHQLENRAEKALDVILVELEERIAAEAESEELDQILEARKLVLATEIAEQFQANVQAAARTHLGGMTADENPELNIALMTAIERASLEAGLAISFDGEIVRRETRGGLDDAHNAAMSVWSGTMIGGAISRTAVGSFLSGASLLSGGALTVIGGAGMFIWTKYRGKVRTNKTMQVTWARESIRAARTELRTELSERSDDVVLLMTMALKTFARGRTESLQKLAQQPLPLAGQAPVSAKLRKDAAGLAGAVTSFTENFKVALPMSTGPTSV